ncbi:hypothetical protein CEXT_254021 [Caerostris extrusa]|uniref:Uncharacterized protein n=1 Tax=Caerostris extrusa TaxID=172846 RepID=A0AAV4NFR4_CAEEX|nr:hypothetical protein CEXT_254021 [Caerostris extrusa]
MNGSFTRENFVALATCSLWGTALRSMGRGAVGPIFAFGVQDKQGDLFLKTNNKALSLLSKYGIRGGNFWRFLGGNGEN